MAKSWYWTAIIPKQALAGDAEEFPSLASDATGAPPFLGAQETEHALELHFEPEAEREQLTAQLLALDAGLKPASIEWRHTDVKPWLEDYWNRLKPLAVGEKLMIIPREGMAVKLAGRLPIHLEPGMAFGTGDHFTTSYCLRRLEWAAAALPPDCRVLDLGTGSGILAIGAHRLGFRNIEAVDVDPDSIEESGKNFVRNGVDGIKLYSGSIHNCAGPYDLIVANLFADLLVAIAPQLKEKLAPGGCAIFSGISKENLPKIEKCFTATSGWEEIHREEGEGWCGVTLRRRSS
jgi:ribosomal protein L11 methyltransferase